MKKLALCATLLCGSCLCPKGMVDAEAIAPSVRAMAPYAKLGIDADANLNAVQRGNLKSEVDLLLGTVEMAAAQK